MASVAVATAALGLVLSGCARNQDSQAIATQWFDALNSHDPARVSRLLDPAAKYTDPTHKEPMSTKDVEPWLSQSWSAWKDRKYTITSVVATPTAVVIEWHMQQTHPSGTPVPLDGATILEHHNGVITQVRDYYNAAVYLQFLRPQ